MTAEERSDQPGPLVESIWKSEFFGLGRATLSFFHTPLHRRHRPQVIDASAARPLVPNARTPVFQNDASLRPGNSTCIRVDRSQSNAHDSSSSPRSPAFLPPARERMVRRFAATKRIVPVRPPFTPHSLIQDDGP